MFTKIGIITLLESKNFGKYRHSPPLLECMGVFAEFRGFNEPPAIARYIESVRVLEKRDVDTYIIRNSIILCNYASVCATPFVCSLIAAGAGGV